MLASKLRPSRPQAVPYIFVAFHPEGIRRSASAIMVMVQRYVNHRIMCWNCTVIRNSTSRRSGAARVRDHYSHRLSLYYHRYLTFQRMFLSLRDTPITLNWERASIFALSQSHIRSCSLLLIFLSLRFLDFVSLFWPHLKLLSVFLRFFLLEEDWSGKILPSCFKSIPPRILW